MKIHMRTPLCPFAGIHTVTQCLGPTDPEVPRVTGLWGLLKSIGFP